MQEKAQGCVPISIKDILSSAGTAVAWLGGAGFLIADKDACLLIDPCLHINENGLTEAGHTAFYPMPLLPDEVPAHTAVLYTHSDGDHMGLQTALRLPKSVHIYAPAPCIRELAAAGLATEHLHLICPGDGFCIGSMHITAIAADHSWQVLNPAYGEPFGPMDCVGFRIETPDTKLLFTGDTRLCAHHLALRDEYDLMALDVSDDPYHLGQENMVQLARHLSHAKLLPCHFGTYDAPDALPHNGSLRKLKELLGKDADRVLPDIIGEIYNFSSKEVGC